MTEENEEIEQAESGLFSDYQRLGDMLKKAQDLAMDAGNYDPSIIRDYFIVLKEIFRFIYPLTDKIDVTKEISEAIEFLDAETEKIHESLLTIKYYKAPKKIFKDLSFLHTELLVLKQRANLGIKMKKRLSSVKKLENVME